MSARPGDRVALAIVISLVAIVLFDGMGLIIKRLSADYTAPELSAYRNTFGLLPSIIILLTSRAWHRSGRGLRMRQWKLACARGLIVTLAQLMFYYSLASLSFATANTITYSNALFMTALAVPLLGEKVGMMRWGAVVLGFIGVVLVVGPTSDGFSWAAIAALAAAFFYALSGVSARMLDDDVPSPLANIYSACVATVGSVIFAFAMGGFSPIHNPSDIWWIAAMGGIGGMAVLCLVVAYRMTEQSNLAPFAYFGIPTAFAFGWIFFGEAPFGDLFPGALLIILGGLIIIWRERRLSAAG